MTDAPPEQPREPTESELRAALEAELKRITVDDVLIQTTVSLVNIGGRRAGLVPGTEGERDLDQVETAIEAVQALIPLLERRGGGEELGPIKDALSRLQLAYTQLRQSDSGGAPPAAPEAGESEQPPKPPDHPGPSPGGGRLWVPGQ